MITFQCNGEDYEIKINDLDEFDELVEQRYFMAYNCILGEEEEIDAKGIDAESISLTD